MKIEQQGFENYLKIRGLKDKSITDYCFYFRKMEIYSTLNQEAVNNFLLSYNQSGSRAFLKNYLEYLKENKISLGLTKEQRIALNHIKIPKLTGKSRDRIPFTITLNQVLEIEKFMTNERNKLMLLISFYGALRVGELTKISYHSFNWNEWTEIPNQQGILKIPFETKTGERIVFLPFSLMNRIYNWIEVSNIQPQDTLFKIKVKHWENILRKISKKALSFPIHPHTLRHSMASYLLEQGMDIVQIKDFLGHKSVATTQIYLHTNPEVLKNKYNEIFKEEYIKPEPETPKPKPIKKKITFKPLT